MMLPKSEIMGSFKLRILLINLCSSLSQILRWSPNDLLYLEMGPLGKKLRLNDVIAWDPNPIRVLDYKKRKRNRRGLSSPGMHKGNVRAQWEDSHLEAGKRALTRNQALLDLDLGLPGPRTVRKKYLLLSHPVCGILHDGRRWLRQWPCASYFTSLSFSFLISWMEFPWPRTSQRCCEAQNEITNKVFSTVSGT